MNIVSSASISKIIGFEDARYAHIQQKLLRDALHSKGNNRLNPYKNRGKRWSWPVIILGDEKAPEGWKNAGLRIQGTGSRCRFETKFTGWGYYLKYDEWLSALDLVTKKGCNIKTDVGRFKIGIPYEEAATEKDCILVTLTLAYQAYRIIGMADEEIKRKYPELYETTKDFKNIKDPICPFCKYPLDTAGFIEITEDTSDVFYKRKEAEDNAIQMFHIECLKPGKFLHRPGNVSWGHRRCNVAMGQHDVSEAEQWFVKVLSNRGFLVKRDE